MNLMTTAHQQTRTGGRSGQWLAVCVLVTALSCAKEQPPAQSDVPAGTVEAVQGPVTAVRGAKGAQSRALAVLSPVFADDTVATPPDGSVSIRLAHNLALWRLDSNMRKRVDRAAAWQATKEASALVMAPQDQPVATVAAGRHSEREAAASAESAQRPHAEPPAGAPEQPAPEQPAPVEAAPAPQPMDDRPVAQAAAAPRPQRRAPSPKRPAAAPSARRSALSSGDDELGLGDLGLGGAGGGGAGGGEKSIEKSQKMGDARVKASAAARIHLAGIQVLCEDEPLKSALATALNRLRTGLERCVEEGTRAGLPVAELVGIELQVSAEGKVERAVMAGTHGPIASCISARLRSLGALPKPSAPQQVHIKLKFAAN